MYSVPAGVEHFVYWEGCLMILEELLGRRLTLLFFFFLKKKKLHCISYGKGKKNDFLKS
jgi:hypothetical protein